MTLYQAQAVIAMLEKQIMLMKIVIPFASCSCLRSFGSIGQGRAHTS